MWQRRALSCFGKLISFALFLVTFFKVMNPVYHFLLRIHVYFRSCLLKLVLQSSLLIFVNERSLCRFRIGAVFVFFGMVACGAAAASENICRSILFQSADISIERNVAQSGGKVNEVRIKIFSKGGVYISILVDQGLQLRMRTDSWPNDL